MKNNEDILNEAIRQKPKKKGFLRSFFKLILSLVLLAVIFIAGFVAYMTAIEYNPDYMTPAKAGTYRTDKKINSESVKILTMNVGYAGLGYEEDFFLDGGKGVNPKSKEYVEKNLAGLSGILKDADADIAMIQEVDENSYRTFWINQWDEYQKAMDGYESYFAYNYRCKYVPYPFTENFREMNSGLASFSKYKIDKAVRYSLPCPFTWPTRIFNIKRCLLTTYIPVEGTNKQLVVINLHLEAYDSGEGKIQQTKQLLNLIEDEYAKGNYVIAGGDFNQSFPNTRDIYPIKPTSSWAPGFLDELPEGWQYAFDDSTPTCRLLNQPYDSDSELTQYYVIDGFIVSPNLKINSVETLNQGFEFSDHNPVMLDVSFGDRLNVLDNNT